jgi:hypothetical protein
MLLDDMAAMARCGYDVDEAQALLVNPGDLAAKGEIR